MAAKLAADQIIKKWLAPALVGGAAATQSEDADAMFLGLAAKGANKAGAKAAHDVFKEHMVLDPRIFTDWRAVVESGRRQSEAARDAGSSRQGWFVGADNKPRYEINDSNASLDRNFTKKFSKLLSERLQNGYYGEGRDHVSTTLERIATHSPLFNAYPEMADMPVWLWKPDSWMLGDSPAGYTVPREGKHPMGEIHLNTGHMAETDRGETLSSLLHEAQHAVQNKEGFARGASYTSSMEDVEAYIRNPQKHSAMSLLPVGEDPWEVHKHIVESKMNRLGRILDASREIDKLPDDDPTKEMQQLATNRMAYMHSAGEAEARAVEDRLRMSAKDRALLHPYGDMRMPIDDAEFYFGDGKRGPTLFQMIEMMTRQGQ